MHRRDWADPMIPTVSVPSIQGRKGEPGSDTSTFEHQARPYTRGGHRIGDCIPTRDRGQSEVKRSRRNFEAGQAVKLGIGGSLSTVKVSPSDRWAWLMLYSQGSRPDFWCGQGVKHGNLLGQDLDPGLGWKYRRLCSVTPLIQASTSECRCPQSQTINARTRSARARSMAHVSGFQSRLRSL